MMALSVSIPNLNGPMSGAWLRVLESSGGIFTIFSDLVAGPGLPEALRHGGLCHTRIEL